MIPGLGRSPGEGIGYPFQYSWASLIIQMVKNLPTMRETWLRSLGWENPLEKGKAMYSSILLTPGWPGEFHGQYSPWGHKESDVTLTFTFSGELSHFLSIKPLSAKNDTFTPMFQMAFLSFSPF